MVILFDLYGRKKVKRAKFCFRTYVYALLEKVIKITQLNVVPVYVHAITYAAVRMLQSVSPFCHYFTARVPPDQRKE
jgi:hypothetical protein